MLTQGFKENFMEKLDVLDMLEHDFNNYNNKNEYEKLHSIFNPLVKDSVIGKGFLFNLRDYTYGNVPNIIDREFK
jgi:hypothetical protein